MLLVFHQVLNPAGSLFLSTVVALVPVAPQLADDLLQLVLPQDAEDLRRGIALYLNDDFSSRGRYRFYRGAESLLQCGCKHRR